MPTLTIVIPVYNEACALPEAVAQVRAAVRPHVEALELLLVESGSTDDSGAVCEALAAHWPDEVRVIREGRRNGFGSALRLGFAAARGELVSMITADLPFPLDSFERALAALPGHDCVLSYRARDPRGLYRRVQSWLYNTLARAVLGVRVRHINSAFKLHRRANLARLDLCERGWLVDAELVAQLERHGMRWVELPVDLIDRTTGRSSVGALTPCCMLRDLLKLAIRLGKTPLSAGRSTPTTIAGEARVPAQSSSSRSSSATCWDSSATCSRRNSSSGTSAPGEPATCSSSSR